MENLTESKTKKYTRYTKKQVNALRKALKEDQQPRLVIAKRFSNEWGIPTRNVYQKLNSVARTKRKYTKRSPKTTTLANVTKTNEGVTLTGDMVNVLDMLKQPTKVVMYNDHVRYYYN
jgi:hypothetical protein